MKYISWIAAAGLFLFFLSCYQVPGIDPIADEISVDDDNVELTPEDYYEMENAGLDKGFSVPAGVLLATSLQAGLNWSRCEVIDNNGSRYARIFGIVRTENPNKVPNVSSQEVLVYYSFDQTNWFRVTAKDNGFTDYQKFKKFYFSTGEIPFDPQSSKVSPVVRFKICYVRNGVDLWVNGFKDFCTTPDPDKAPRAKDGSKYTQSIPGLFHDITENFRVSAQLNTNGDISSYLIRSYILSKYIPSYQLKNGTNTKRMSFHCLAWPSGWVPPMGDSDAFIAGWDWQRGAYRSDISYRAYYYDATLSSYFKTLSSNLGVADPDTLVRYYYKHYTNGYESYYLEYALPATTKGIQFFNWSESWNQKNTRYQFFDRNRCKRYWIAMPTNGGENVLRFCFNYNFSEYLKASSAVVAATIPQ
jgi:hypothetical protein